MSFRKYLLSNVFRDGTGGAPPPPPPLVVPPAAPPPTVPWYTETVKDAEIIDHWQNRGWHTKTAAEIAVEATKAHKEAEKFIGVPSDQIIRLPKEASDEAGWNQVWSRLGRPTDAKGYDFSTLKHKDGKDVETVLADTLRNAAFAQKLPKEAALGMAKEVVKHLDGKAEAENAERTSALTAEKTKLADNWKGNTDTNMVIARNAAAALNVTPEEVAALEQVVGYSRVMEMFRSIGTKIGEDKFVRNENQLSGVMSKDAARATLADRMADTAWGKRLVEGDSATKREWEALSQIIAA